MDKQDNSKTNAQTNSYAGLGALLTPENCALLFIDHQPFQYATLGSISTQAVLNNVVGLAKTAKVFNVPTLLTCVIQDRSGFVIKQLADVYPDQTPIDRTFINAWEDSRIVQWVEKTGRKKIVVSGLWTEVCVAMVAIQAMGEGYEVYCVTDASGGVSVEAHQMAIARMTQAGVIPITFGVFQAELQRDWARVNTAAGLIPITIEHQGAVGQSIAWEYQLLGAQAKN